MGIQLNLVMKSERCADACAPERGVYEHGRCYCDETQRVQYRSGVWVNVNEEPAQTLGALTDVDFGGSPQPQGGEALVFDGPSRTWKPDQPGAILFTKVELTTLQNVSADTAVAWDQVRAGESHGDLMWNSAEPTRLVAIGKGMYLFGFHMDTPSNSTQGFPGVYKNGADKSDITLSESTVQTGDTAVTGSRVTAVPGAVILEDGDFLEAVLSFAGFNIEANNNVSFWLLKVAAL